MINDEVLVDRAAERSLAAAVLCDPGYLDRLRVAVADLYDPHARAALGAAVNVYAAGDHVTIDAVRGWLQAQYDLRAGPHRAGEERADLAWFDKLLAEPLPDAPLPIDAWESAIIAARDRRTQASENWERREAFDQVTDEIYARILRDEQKQRAREDAAEAEAVRDEQIGDPRDLDPPTEAPSYGDIPPAEPAGPEAEGSKKRAPRGGGAVDLAVRYVERHCMHADGPTLRRWRGDWYRWSTARGHYVRVGDEAIDKSLFRDFGMSRPADVRDVRAALIAADDVLIDEVELGSWIGEPAMQHAAHDVAACPNGLLHLRSLSMDSATPRFFSTTSLGVAYDPAAPSPKQWLAFLRELWPPKDHASKISAAIAAGDKQEAERLRAEERKGDESIAALQEWFGYLLTPDTRQQKILLLVGPKRSGKGTIMRILKALLGEDSVAAPTLASLGTNFGLWPLIGKTAAIIGDARLSGRSDIAQIVERLLSLSGEDAQTIDRKHREPWTGYLSARMTIVSNELPRFTDASDALSSRMLILELEQSFYGRENTGLTDALRGELPGILLWAIEGWRRLRDCGHFVQPEGSASLMHDLADLASPVAAWVRERCKRGDSPEYQVECKRAFTDYQDWATGEGQQHKVTLATFGRDLKAAAQVSRVQVRNGATRSWRYLGIRLRELHEVDEAESVTGCH